jgi:hypothetical protein
MAIAIAVLALCAACTSSTQRPEGVVEEWLLSLNQGAAGDPGRYGGAAAEEAAAAVLPDWRTADPGSIDRIQVGGDFSSASGAGGVPNDVPFRVETTEGQTIEGVVHVAPCGDDPATVDADPQDWCVRGAGLGGVEISPDWTWSVGAGSAAWGWAALAAVVFTLVAVGLVLVVRRTAAASGGPTPA